MFLSSCLGAAVADETDGQAAALPPTVTAPLRDLVANHRAHPNDLGATRDLEQSVAAGLPNELDPSLLPDLPVETEAVAGGLGTVARLRDYLPSRVNEPQHDWTFIHVVYLYRPAVAGRMPLFCRVHYSELTDERLATRMGRLLLLARDTMVKAMKRRPFNDDRPFDVWLCRGGQSAGEQWRDNVYLYDLDTPRSSIEWIREIVHEYGHLALPAIGGYDAPEYWANGYMGERVIVRWIQRRPDGPDLVEKLWGDFSGAANFDRLLITPAIDLYTRIGPNPKWVRRTDADGMRYFIGQVLTIDDKYGSQTLGRVFSDLPRFREAKPEDVVSSLVALTPRALTHPVANL